MSTRISPNEFSYQIAKQYNFENWARPSQAERTVFIHKFFLWGNEFGPEWVTRRLHTEQRGRGMSYTRADVQHSREAISIRMEIHETASATIARSLLLELLTQFTSGPVNRQEGAGDIHIAFSTGDWKSVVYAFANTVIKLTWFVLSQANGINPSAEVRQFTSIFAEKSHGAKSERQPKITQFQTPVPKMKPDFEVPLDVRVIDPLNRPVWYRFTSMNGEVTTSPEGSLVYTPFSTGPQSITLMATNADGLTSHRELRLV